MQNVPPAALTNDQHEVNGFGRTTRRDLQDAMTAIENLLQNVAVNRDARLSRETIRVLMETMPMLSMAANGIRRDLNLPA